MALPDHLDLRPRTTPRTVGSCSGRRRCRAPPARRGPARWPAHGDAQPAPGRRPVGAPLLTATPVVTVLLDRRAAGNLATVAGSLAAALGPIDPGDHGGLDHRRRDEDPRRAGLHRRRPARRATTSASRTRSTTCPACGSPAPAASSRPTPGSRARCCPPSAARPRRSWTAPRAGRCSRSTTRATRSARSSKHLRGRARPSPPASTWPSRPRPRTP